jgi:hypothetical protein
LNPIVPVLDMTGNPTGWGTVLEGLTPDLSNLVFGSYFNGVGAGSQLTAMTIDSTNHLVFTGTTFAYQGFPTTTGVVQPNAPSNIPPGASGYQHQYVASIDLTTAQGFTLTASGTSSQTVQPGGTAMYTFSVGPSVGLTIPSMTLSVSGQPPGSSATFAPTSIPAGIGSRTVGLTVNVPNQMATRDSNGGAGGHAGLIALGFLLLPFTCRLSGRRPGRLTMVALLAGAAVLTGCGGSTGSGSTVAGTYTITVTATAGAVSHVTTVTLVVT